MAEPCGVDTGIKAQNIGNMPDRGRGREFWRAHHGHQVEAKTRSRAAHPAQVVQRRAAQRLALAAVERRHWAAVCLGRTRLHLDEDHKCASRVAADRDEVELTLAFAVPALDDAVAVCL